MYVHKKQAVYMVRSYPQFDLSALDLGMYPPRVQRSHCTHKHIVLVAKTGLAIK